MAIVRIQLRHDTKNNWHDINPLLASGEAGVETDTGRIKVGDGIRYWRQLSYSSGQLSDNSPNFVGPLAFPGVSNEASRADHQHPLPQNITVQNLTVGTNAIFGGSVNVAGSLVGGTHKHGISDITDLGSRLETFAATEHKHSVENITDFPSSTNQDGKYLTTDGTDLYWQTVSGASGSAISKVNSGTGILVTADTQDSTNITVGLADSSVASVNNKSGDVTLHPGSNVQITESGNNITISATTSSSGTAGVSSIEGIAGTVNIVDGANITTSVSGQDITIAVAAHDHTHSQITDFGDGVNASIDIPSDSGLVATFNSTTDIITLRIDEDIRSPVTPPTPTNPEPPINHNDPLTPDVVVVDSIPEIIPIDGTAARLAVVLRHDTGASFQWQRKDADEISFSDLSADTKHAGVTTKVLLVSGLTVDDDSAVYRLKITNAEGVVTLTSEGIIKTSTLEISTQPQDMEIVDGTSLGSQDRIFLDWSGSRTGKVWVRWILHQFPPEHEYLFSSADDPNWSRSQLLAANLNSGWFLQARALIGTNGRAYCPRITTANYEWIGSDYGTDSGVVQKGYLFAEVYEEMDPTDQFLGPIQAANSARLATRTVEITIAPGTPAITVQPVNATISGTNTASFSFEFEYGAPVVWFRKNLDGTSGPVDLTSDPGEPPRNTVVPSLVGGGNQIRSTLTLTDLENYSHANATGDIGTLFRARVGSGVDAPYGYSQWANLVGVPPTITQSPTITSSSSLIAGATGQAVARFTPNSGTVQWQTRAANFVGGWSDVTNGSVVTSSGVTTFTTPVMTLQDDRRQYRVKVTGAGTGASHTISTAITFGVTGAVSPGDSLFTNQLQPEKIFMGGTYAGAAESNLLVGASAVSHYAAILVEYDDGVKEVRALSNGTRGNAGAGEPLRYFPANAYHNYQVSVSGLSEPCTIKVIVATDPFQLTLVSGQYRASPFRQGTNTYGNTGFVGASIRLAGSGAIASQTFVRQTVFGRTGDEEVDTSDISISFPFPPIGFSVSQTARVTIEPQRAALVPAMRTGEAGPFVAPESYLFLGAANEHNEVICAPRGSEYNMFIFSDNEGLDYRTFFFPVRIQAASVLYWQERWWVFGKLDGVWRCLRCPRGQHHVPSSWQLMSQTFGPGIERRSGHGKDFNTWTSTGNNIYGSTYGNLYRCGLSASVVNNNLYVATSKYTAQTYGRMIFRNDLVRFSPGTGLATINANGGTVPQHAYRHSTSNQPFSHTYRINNSGTSLLSGYNISTNSGLTWSSIEHTGNGFNPVSYPVSVESSSQNYTLIGGYPWGSTGFGFAPQLSTGGLSSATSVLSSLSSMYASGGHSHNFGPQIGDNVYGVGTNAYGHYCILRFRAYLPQQATPLVTLPNYGKFTATPVHSGEGSSSTIDNATISNRTTLEALASNITWNQQTGSDIFRGSYRYGSEDQLPDSFLDGTNSCGNGAIVFTKNHALVMYRYYISPEAAPMRTYNPYITTASYGSHGSPTWWTSGPSRTSPSTPPTMR